jgi:hypothetical protein
VLTGAITRTIATEVTGQDLDLEQSYRFGFARLGPVLVVSILVGLATLLAAVATTVTLPYGALVGVLLYLDLRARKERLDLDTLKANLQASTA